MSVDVTTEKRFESDIEASFLSSAGGYTHNNDLYDPVLGVYPDTLIRFIQMTQPNEWKRFTMQNAVDQKRKFCLAFNTACDMDGLITVMRHGFKHRGITFRVCYFKPESSLNQTAAALYAKNEITCNRQWFYSTDTHNSVDMMIAVNGIPVFAFELKNQYTGQNVDNAKRQWMYDRDPREICFQFNKRILGFFCVDQLEAWMTTKLEGKDTFFLPFNQGSNGAGNDGGKGNPANPNGYPTAYLWEYVFQKDSMMDILQKFIHLQIKEDRKLTPDGSEKITKKKSLIFPRYHQLDVVRKLKDDVSEHGAGVNYLIQHSAGSGKSNSIAWTAYRLASLHDEENRSVFGSVIVVTDRTVLDAQLQETISGFDHTLGAVETIGEDKNSKNLRDAINDGVRIIVTTLQKFPVIYQEVDKKAGRNFAVIVDEAHSSQTGSSAMKLKAALADTEAALREYAEIEGKAEEEIDRNDKLVQEMITHGKHPNLSFFAFTATPKAQTLEMFGEPWEDGSFDPFHIYSMHQAIEEGFILDVLTFYTPYSSYYRVLKAIEDDPEYDKKKALGKIRAYVERQPETIEKKAEIIVEHFCKKVYMKIGGHARAMVITSSIERAIEFYKTITRMLEERNSPYKAIVAFTDKVIDGKVVTESELNGFPSAEIEQRIEQDPYRFLIVADKFQTGYDQPLLHTMYVDKQISDLKAVQTLSRLNRCHPKKQDTFVLDFANDPDMIRQSFQRYYKTTILAGESDINKLNDLTETIEGYNFYTQEDVDNVAELKLMGTDEDRPKIDAIIDADVKRFKEELNEDGQIKCKSAIKNFCRCYPYFSSIMPFESPEWEKQYIFYALLVRKLPKLKIDDNTQGLLDDIDFDKYRIVKEEERAIVLENENTSVNPIPVGIGGGKPEPEMDALSNIVKDFNDTYGNIEWKNRDEVQRQIEELPARIATSVDFVNAVRNGDRQVAQITFNDDIINIVAGMLEEKTEFVQTYFANQDFQNFVNARVFQAAVSQLSIR